MKAARETNSPASSGTRKKTEKKSGSKQPRGGGDSKKRLRAGIIAGAAAVAVLAVFLVGGGLLVGAVDTIYPNVSVDGVEVGGLTLPEAARKLSEEENDTDDRSVTVLLPLGHKMTITDFEAGLALDDAAAAKAAFDYGRGGNMFTNLFAYLGCLFGGHDIADDDNLSIDEKAVRDSINAAVGEVYAKQMDSSVEIGEDFITAIKGSAPSAIDSDEIYSLIATAFAEQSYGELSYNQQGQSNDDIDLQALYDTVYVEPVGAVYDPEAKAATLSVTGISFDMAEARRLWDEASDGDMVMIPLIKTEPDITTEYLNSVLFMDLLAQRSTTLGGSSASRVNNITKAAASINGLVLNPGNEFSYNEALGERTAAAGYQYAGAYMNGRVVSEIGGGICQVSSTLYFCTLLSNLEITDRTCHYFAVSYLPAGLDATVSWGGPDFKFKNDRDFPIRLEAYVDTSSYSVVVKIWGTDVDGSYVEMRTETWATNGGTGAVSYRLVFDKDGNLLSKTEESRSQYHYLTDDSTAPPASSSPSPSEEPVTSPTGDPTTQPTDDPSAPPTGDPSNPTPTVTAPPVVTEPPAVTDPPVATEPPAATPPAENPV